MSTGADCRFIEKTKGQWFYELQQYPYGSNESYDKFGPFPHFKAAVHHLDRNHANPGGFSVQPLPGCSHDMLVEVGQGDKDCERCGAHIPNPEKMKQIRMYSHSPCIFTAEEYEQMKKDVEARVIAGLREPGDRILANMIRDNSLRYHEIKKS